MASDLENGGVEAKLETLIRLVALSVAPPGAPLKDRAVTLSKAGLTPKDIAALCDTTPNTVSQALSAAKRAKKRRS